MLQNWLVWYTAAQFSKNLHNYVKKQSAYFSIFSIVNYDIQPLWCAGKLHGTNRRPMGVNDESRDTLSEREEEEGSQETKANCEAAPPFQAWVEEDCDG